jgi:hypothetical protein
MAQSQALEGKKVEFVLVLLVVLLLLRVYIEH